MLLNEWFWYILSFALGANFITFAIGTFKGSVLRKTVWGRVILLAFFCVPGLGALFAIAGALLVGIIHLGYWVATGKPTPKPPRPRPRFYPPSDPDPDPTGHPEDDFFVGED